MTTTRANTSNPAAGAKNSSINEALGPFIDFALSLSSHDQQKMGSTPLEFISYVLSYFEVSKKQLPELYKSRLKQLPGSLAANTPTNEIKDILTDKKRLLEWQRDKESAALDNQIKLLKQVKDAVTAHDKLSTELKELQEDRASQTTLIQQLKQELQTQTKQFHANQTKLTNLNKVLDKFSTGNESLSVLANNNNALTVTLGNLQSEYQLLQGELKEANDAVVRLTQRVNEQEEQLSSQTQLVAQAVNDSKEHEQLQTTITDFSTKSNAQTFKIEELELINSLLTKTIEALKASEEKLQKDLAALKMETDNERKSTEEKFKKELLALTTEAEKEQKRLKAALIPVAELKLEIEKQKEMMQQQMKEVGQLRASNASKDYLIQKSKEQKNSNVSADGGNLESINQNLVTKNAQLVAQNQRLQEEADTRNTSPNSTIFAFVTGAPMAFVGLAIALLAVPIAGWILFSIGALVTLYGAYEGYKLNKRCQAVEVRQAQEQGANLAQIANGTYRKVGNTISIAMPAKQAATPSSTSSTEPGVTANVVVNNDQVITPQRSGCFRR